MPMPMPGIKYTSGTILQFLCCFFASICVASSLNPDGTTLLSLLKHWNVAPPSIRFSWNASHSTPCSWVGVQCDRNTQFVVALNLSGYGVSGLLGPEIAHITHLRLIDFSMNSFYGSIPSELGNCNLLQLLDLSSNSFTGGIPQTIGNLQNLRFISLYGNSLNGTIPESLFATPHLETVYLNNNSLTGTIPSNVGNASQLLYLWLYGNQLSGLIPPSVGNCTSLQELYLNDNNLVGLLPESLDKLEHLVYLEVSSNMLEGSIPFVSGNCKEADTFVFSNNLFKGGIPSALGNCSSLTTLAAITCGLSGPVPSSFGQLSELQRLYLSDNHLSGKIPLELGKCKSLVDLRLDENKLEGEIPSELGMLSELKSLFLYTNRLTGEIPLSIWKIQGLEDLQVYQNNLSGRLPAEVAELKQLKNLALYGNKFTGVIPQGLGINSSLVEVDFTDNQFTGDIPPYLCFGDQLRILNLGHNNFRGSIPPSVGSCSNLTRLILKQNQLAGVIPYFVENPNLEFMDLTSNDLTGALPSSLGNLTNIGFVGLSMNKLSGPVPAELGRLVDLHVLNLSHNNLEGELPSQLSNCNKLLQLDLSSNSLNGSIPTSLSSLTQLIVLDLTGNNFAGGVPAFLFELDVLTSLHLGGNLFGGSIPSSIGTTVAAQNLRSLNFSSNNLVGELPLELGRLTMLEELDISRNHLSGSLSVLSDINSLVFIDVSQNLFSGPIPEALLKFLNSSPTSFAGNPGLCISCVQAGDSDCGGKSILRPCNLPSSDKGGRNKVEIPMIVLGSLMLFVLILVGLSCWFLRKKGTEVENAIAANEGASYLLNEIMEATENLNDRYLIGRGAHGTVYKAVLSSGKVYAVKKVMSAGIKRGSKSMLREIQTIGTVRHRNLVKLEEFWFRRDYGLILYSYMKNGSLHDVLHGHPPRPLEWKIRYKIALGTAQGLSYLHSDCNPEIVHRDIKPMNILLDSELEPHISDFGIAKLLDHSATTASLSSGGVPGTIGYIAPENAFTTRRSKESDVYSYGVVLLELITRKKPLGPPSFHGEGDIVSRARAVWDETGEIKRIVDPSLVDELMDSSIMEQVTNVFLVALRCTEEWNRRPSMRAVVKQLTDSSSCSSASGGSKLK